MADRWLNCPICHEITRGDDAKDLKKTFCGGCGRLFTQADILAREGWVYAKNRQKIGPIGLEQLRQQSASGQLLPTDMVLEPGKTRWVAASTFGPLFANQTAPAGTAPAPAARPATSAPVAVEPVLVEPFDVGPAVATPSRPNAVQPIPVEPIAVEPLQVGAVVTQPPPSKAVPVEPILVEPMVVSSAKVTVKPILVEPILVEPIEEVTVTAATPMVAAASVTPPAEMVTASVTPTVPPAPTAPAPQLKAAVVDQSSPASIPQVAPAPAAAPPPLTAPAPPAAAAVAPTPEPIVPQPAAPVFVEPIFVEPEEIVAQLAPPVTTFPVTPVAVEPIAVEPEPAEPTVSTPLPSEMPAPIDVAAIEPASAALAEPPAPPRELGWFYVRYGQKLGPATLVELQEMVEAGQLWPTDMVMKEETNNWQPATTLPGLFPEEKKIEVEAPAPPQASSVAEAAPVGGDRVVPAERPAVAPTEPSVAKPSWPQLPGYEILDELQRGERWVICKAQHLHLKKVMALKLLRPDRDFAEQELSRLRKGADASTRLRHPGIVAVEAVGEAAGRPYLALEYVEGESLDKRIGTPQPAHSAARLVQLLAEAVDYAHERGLVHGDLRPANVLVVRSQESGVSEHPKITGFGTGEAFDPGRAKLQALGYVAPEQISGDAGDGGRAADVYALGMMLYELITGRTPFLGATVPETLELVKTLEPVSPRRLQPSVPLDLDTICLKCLQKHADLRYASAGALADDLRRFQAGERISSRPLLLLVRGVSWARQQPREAALIALTLLLFGLIFVRNVDGLRQSAQTVPVLQSELTDALDRLAAKEKALTKMEGERDGARALVSTLLADHKGADAELAAYRKISAAMVEQLRRSPDAELAYSVLWTCVLDAQSPADAGQVLEAAEKLVARHPKCPPHFLVLRGAALYRAGQFAAALQRLDEALAARPEPPAAAWLFLAMIHQRLGHAADARTWLDKAMQWIDDRASGPSRNDLRFLELEMLLREADRLIQPK